MRAALAKAVFILKFDFFGFGRFLVKQDSKEHEIFQTISNAIVTQRLPPGTRLREDEVGSSFGVSRTVVRSALRRLAQEGVLEIFQNRGAFVAQPSKKQANDIFEARIAIECEIVRKAAQLISESELIEIRALVDKDHEANNAGDIELNLRLSCQFHGRLAEIAGNEILGAFAQELISRSALIVGMYGAPEESSCLIGEHYEIVNHLGKGDGSAAVEAMKNHLNHMVTHLQNLDSDSSTERDRSQGLMGLLLNGR